MNLVMHRNYQTNAPAKFYEYSDRIEIDNPGNLYGKARPENFPNENDYRNPIIADAMKNFGYVNSFGRGINMVQEELEANKNGLAVFEFDDMTSFKVTVMNADLEAVKALENEAEMKQKNEAEKKQKKEAEKLSQKEVKILDFIKNDNEISRLRIANLLNISESSVYREIEKLKKKGILDRVGGNRGGYWKIN